MSRAEALGSASTAESQELQWVRVILRWISRHSILSSAIALVAVFALASTRFILTRTQGLLSDPVRRGTIVDAVYGIGTVTATRSYSIKPGIISTLQETYVKEGDAVRKGERLVNLDGNVYRAPFSGVVNYLPFKSGENIFVQLPVLVLTDLSHRYIVVSLEQQGAIRVRAGQKVKLSFDSMRQQNYEGIVESVYSYSTSFLARINVSSLPAEILPEMTADVAIVVREATRALVIPVNAIENGVVWRKRGAMIPEKTEIKLGIVDGAFAELVSGDIQEGDRLLIRKKVSP